MSALLTQTEEAARRPLTPTEIFKITAARETTLARLLMLYISTGLFFMLLPGTFLGGLEPARDQQPPRGELCVANMDSGARSCPNLRLDRNLHLGYRFLFHSQVTSPQLVCIIRGVVIVGFVD